MDNEASFGTWIRRRRRALDLTQDELSQRVGCALDTIRKIESGARRPSRQIAERLANQLEVPAETRAAFLQAARAELVADRLPLPTSIPSSGTPGNSQHTAPLVGLPTGTITFFCTDIAGSTQLWEQHAEAMRLALARHDTLLRQTIAAHDGIVFKSGGDGLYAAFTRAPGALAAAVAAQQALLTEPWRETGPLHVRMVLHTGAAEERDGDYFGPPLNRAARLLAVGHGGQILLSRATQELVCDALPLDVKLRDMGIHRLKDLTRPEHIFQIIAPALPVDFPPLKTLETRPHNLPAQLTPLIGRTAEIAAVCDRLRRDNVRLLTLTGPGGIGKTRLALQVGAEMLDDFAGGVYFVDLAPVSDPSLVMSTIAQELGLQDIGDQSLIERLKAYLKSKLLLLMLDNFEHIVDAAPLVEELLVAAPHLKALITSRMVLHLYGEHEVIVPLLAVPDPTHLPPLDRLSQYDAVRLFVQQAQAVRADFTLTNVNAPAVAAICARLDGLPLAIELAAARSKLFAPDALLTRLSSRLQLLTGGARTLPARQQTLRNTIDWSYNLLDMGEQRLFTRLGVFVGGSTLEAVAAVCNANADLEMEVLDGIASLVDKSLLRPVEASNNEARFTMLETIREYALERLVEAGELETLRERHAAYLLALCERIDTEFSGSKQVVWLARMRAEHANHRTALEWAVEHGAIETGVRLATMWWWGGNPVPVTEARRWLEKLLRQGSSLPISLRAQMLMTMGDLAIKQYDYPSAQTLLGESLVLFRTIGELDRIATNLHMLGQVAVGKGDHRQALEFLTESRVLFLELGNTVHLAMSLLGLGVVLSLEGDYAQAIALCTESLALAQECGNTLLKAWTFKHLGNLAQRQGDAGQARELLANSLALFQDAGDMVGIMAYLEGMAEVAGIERDPERLVQLFGAVVALHISLGVSSYPAEQAAYEQQLLAAHAQLGEGAYALAWDAGRAMTVEQAVALTRVTRARG